MAANEHDGDDLAARLARCYTGVVYDVMRGLGHTDCILPPSIVPLDVGMVAAGPVFTVRGRPDASIARARRRVAASHGARLRRGCIDAQSGPLRKP